MSGLPVTVGAGLQSFCCGARLEASNHGGVTLRVESDDPSRVLVAPNTSTAGAAFFEVFVPNGSTNVSYVVQGIAGTTGTATVTVTASGFTAGSGTVTVAQPAAEIIFLLSSIDSLNARNPFQVRVGLPTPSNSSLQTVQAARVGGGPLTATVMNSEPTVGELQAAVATGQTVSLTIAEGQSASPGSVASGGIAFGPLTTGTTTVNATIPGFIATDAATRNVTVTAPGITMSGLPATVGAGLQSFCCGARLDASNHGGVTLRVESDDPSRVLVAPNTSTAGTAFFEVFLPNGSTNVSYVVQGIAGTTGTATVTVTASGFTAGTGTVTVAQPAMEIINLLSSIDSLDPPDPFQVRVGLPTPSNSAVQIVQAARVGGGPLTATVMNSEPTVGELQTLVATGQMGTVTLSEGQSSSPGSVASGGIAFAPLTTGTTTVNATIPGFIATDAATRNVTVTAPGSR